MGDTRVFARAAGAYVVIHDGDATLYLDRGGRSLQTLPAFADPAAAVASLRALGELVADGRLRAVQVERVDGVPVGESGLSPRASRTRASGRGIAGYLLAASGGDRPAGRR